MKVTLKDIAESTGYSISTVSRVLNGSEKIGEVARKKILVTARNMNYPIPDEVDDDAIYNTLKIFFIMTGFHRGEFYASFFHGINQAVEKGNIRLSLISIQKPFDELLLTIKDLSNQKYDGLVLYTPGFTTEQYRQIKQILPENYPVVSNHNIENPVFPTVTFDSYSGGYLAAQHFHERGYKELGVIEGPIQRTGSRNRANGFKDYIRKTPGLTLSWRFRGELKPESGVKAFKEFDKLDQKPRAIFSCNDVMCHAFMQEAMAAGYQFPDDIAIVGYDDLPLCSRNRPTISSIHTDYERLGAVTIDLMKEMLSDPGAREGIITFVPVSLSARESS
ncbi:MAG: LacI family DNA-binding transcriptional regulator [Balneolaceae bacterium]|nr:LacI family DNA-binding transcriptional regulator [Balneolaceae bacterium]